MKHYKKHNTNHHRSLFFSLGLVVSLLLVISAFQWRTSPVPTKIGCPFPTTAGPIFIPEMPKTTQTPPVPPKLMVETPPRVITKVEEKLKAYFKSVKTIKTTTKNFLINSPDDPPIKAPEAPFEVIEDPPFPVGGYKSFGAFLKKHLKYPKQAKRLGIEGKVFVQFVVNEDGSLSALTLLKGIGGGCDEEAIRVLRKHPKWTPGYQRGRAVKVRMVVPISFQLN